MKDIVSYSKGTERLEKREEFIFKLIDDLDKESSNLFDEIVNLSNESYYKLENLSLRCTELLRIYNQMYEGFEYINNIEMSSYDYAAKRYQLKRTLTAMSTVYLSLINVIAGIAAFILLSEKATDDFYNELIDINESVDRFDEDRVTKIENTLYNCSRLLAGKYNKLYGNLNMLAGNIDEEWIVARSNDIISSFINGCINETEISLLPLDIKDNIVCILKQDLNVDLEDINELLSLAKNKNTEGLKLIKEY